MLGHFCFFWKKDNGYNLSILSEQVSKWMSNLYSVLCFVPVSQQALHCIAATDKLSAVECGSGLAGYLQLQLRSSPPLLLLLLQLKHENLLRSGDSWSPPIWMAWADSVLAILMGQTQPKLASVSRNAHPVALPALWPNILLAQSRLLQSHRDPRMVIIMHFHHC